MLFCPKCQQLEPTSSQRNKDGTVTHLCKACGNAIPLRRDLKPGEVVAGFQIEEELGRGAMGIVYQARQTNLDREVAIKILSDDSASDEVYVERFFREARAAASLSHPNVVQAYDAGVTDDGIYYFVMEKVTGENLDLVLNNLGPLNIPQALDVFISVANALAYAWSRNQLSHGDIKPENIIMRLNGKVKLADFGLARRAKDPELDEEDIRATPAYAPPEIIRGDKDVPGFKSDMYSFGATAYHVLIGHEPFVDTDPAKVCAMQLSDIQRPLSELNPNIPQRLSDLVDALMEKDPANRPASWDDVVAELKEIRYELNSASPARLSAATPARGNVLKKAVSLLGMNRNRFSVWEIVTAASALVAVIVLIVFLCLRFCGNEPGPENDAPSGNDALPKSETATPGKTVSPEAQARNRALELRKKLLDEAAAFRPEKAGSMTATELDRLYRSVETRSRELEKLDKSLPESVFSSAQQEKIRKYLADIAVLQREKILGGSVSGRPAQSDGSGRSEGRQTPDNDRRDPVEDEPDSDAQARLQIRVLELRNALLDEAAAFNSEDAASMTAAELDSLYRSVETRYSELVRLDNALAEPIFLPSQRGPIRQYIADINLVLRSKTSGSVESGATVQSGGQTTQERDPAENARDSAAIRNYERMLESLPAAIQSESSRTEALRMANELLADVSFTDGKLRKNCIGIRRFLVLNQQALLPFLAADKETLRNMTLFTKAYPDSMLEDIDMGKRTLSLSVPGRRVRMGVSWSKLRNEEGEDRIVVTLINSPAFPRLSEDFREYLFVRALFLGVDPETLKRRFDRASGLSGEKKAELNAITRFFLKAAPDGI